MTDEVKYGISKRMILADPDFWINKARRYFGMTRKLNAINTITPVPGDFRRMELTQNEITKHLWDLVCYETAQENLEIFKDHTNIISRKLEQEPRDNAIKYIRSIVMSSPGAYRIMRRVRSWRLQEIMHYAMNYGIIGGYRNNDSIETYIWLMKNIPQEETV